MDYEKEMAKLQKDCEERLESKVQELMNNIEAEFEKQEKEAKAAQ
jgi:mRNA-degrading endonuclease RelE of RelBE toxin-antitoxin system